eukprot:tig00001302_g8088.t1
MEVEATGSGGFSAFSNGSSSSKVNVTVEVCLLRNSTAKQEVVAEAVRAMLKSPFEFPMFKDGPLAFSKHDFLRANVASIVVSDIGDGNDGTGIVLRSDAVLSLYVFQLNEEGVCEDTDANEDVSSFRQYVLPAREFHGMWESLIFDSSVKRHLLEYATSAILFADKGIDTRLITWNRVILLHGPPGTGKTSLCQAIAQKLTIRLSERYTYGQLIEVNAHGLFSKWFSESGKLVGRLFDKLKEFVDDPHCLVCVLIDEVESLAAARKAALAGTEPSDAIRVVNALLTRLDALKEHKNVLVLTTSNITEAIDVAFVDRADLKQYIGPPSARARYQILRSCVAELMRCGIIAPERPLYDDARSVELPSEKDRSCPSDAYKCSQLLYQAALKCEGLSGRSLRKLPFLAHAGFLQAPSSTFERYVWGLHAAAEREAAGRRELSQA